VSNARAHLVRAPAALRHHRLGPLGVEKLRAVLEAQHLLQLLGLGVLSERLHSTAQHSTESTAQLAQHSAGQDRRAQHRQRSTAQKAQLAQHGTLQRSTAQHGTLQRSTAHCSKRSTVQHSRKQHSTAQQSTAQHGRAQHSTASAAQSTAQHTASSAAQRRPARTAQHRNHGTTQHRIVRKSQHSTSTIEHPTPPLRPLARLAVSAALLSAPVLA
jgi:hypothetical protein